MKEVAVESAHCHEVAAALVVLIMVQVARWKPVVDALFTQKVNEKSNRVSASQFILVAAQRPLRRVVGIFLVDARRSVAICYVHKRILKAQPNVVPVVQL